MPSNARLFVTPWTVAHQAPLPTGFSRQEHWSGWPCPSPGVFWTQGLDSDLLSCTLILLPLTTREAWSGNNHHFISFSSWRLSLSHATVLPLSLCPGVESVLSSFEMQHFFYWWVHFFERYGNLFLLVCLLPYSLPLSLWEEKVLDFLIPLSGDNLEWW